MFLDIIIFLLVLSILVLVHELGHFLTAKKAGIKVEEFGFGIPPRIAGIKRGETVYSLNLFPFGGFVRLHGENQGDRIEEKDRAYMNKSKKIRALVVSAGVIMNVILAVFLFAVVYSFSGIPRKTGEVEIYAVMENTPAAESGLEEGDIIQRIDGETFSNNEEFKSFIDEKSGTEVTMVVAREGKGEVDVRITPRKDPPPSEGSLGVIISDTETFFPPVWQRPFLGAFYGVKEAIFWGTAVLSGFWSMIVRLFSGTIPKDVTGPAGLLVITSEVAKVGFFALLNWMGIISINLAILNILPIPALDGGRLFFIFLEKVFGRRVLPRVENWLHALSLGLLITLMVAVTIKEVRLISELGFSGFIDYLSTLQGE